MKHINLKGSWIIKASIGEVFKIISDFENMPNNFPAVAESLVITKKRRIFNGRNRRRKINFQKV